MLTTDRDASSVNAVFRGALMLDSDRHSLLHTRAAPIPHGLLDGLSLHDADLPDEALRFARNCRVVAWDIETSGLHWVTDRIATCQVYVPNHAVYVVRVDAGRHDNLRALLADPDVTKLFHHAVFDLRFLSHHWGVVASNVMCTKIASKVLNPGATDHTLKGLLARYLSEPIEKGLRMSNWFGELTEEQLRYAATDVVHLPRLFRVLADELRDSKRWPLAQASFDYLPTRVALDLAGCQDVFTY